jgi:hypothetical protein
MFKDVICAVLPLALLSVGNLSEAAQWDSGLDIFFRKNIGLSQDQIVTIRNGEAVTKPLPPRSPSEVFLFGAVHIHAAPESYFQYVWDIERRRKLPNYLALGVIN